MCICVLSHTWKMEDSWLLGNWGRQFWSKYPCSARPCWPHMIDGLMQVALSVRWVKCSKPQDPHRDSGCTHPRFLLDIHVRAGSGKHSEACRLWAKSCTHCFQAYSLKDLTDLCVYCWGFWDGAGVCLSQGGGGRLQGQCALARWGCGEVRWDTCQGHILSGDCWLLAAGIGFIQAMQVWTDYLWPCSCVIRLGFILLGMTKLCLF